MEKAEREIKDTKGVKASLGRVQRYIAFATYVGEDPWPTKYRPIALFLSEIVRLNNGSSKSIHTYLRAITNYTKRNGLQGLSEADQLKLDDLMKYYDFMDAIPSVQKDPIDMKMLLLMTKLTDKDQISEMRFLTIAWLSYDGMLRVSEALRDGTTSNFVWNAERTKFTMILFRTKTVRKGPAVQVHYANRKGPCAVKFMRKWFILNNLFDVSADRRLIFPSPYKKAIGSLSHGWYRTQIKEHVAMIGLDPNRFSSHSFRAGAATDFFRAGVPMHIIMHAGRWKSTAVLLYYRDQLDKQDQTFQAFQSIYAAINS